MLQLYCIFTTRIVCFFALLVAWALPLPAAAHPQLDEGKRLFADLELEPSLTAFQAAVDSAELSRDELVELLSERSLVLHALHRKEELIADFVWLSALAPERILDMRAPPALVAMWISVRDQGRGALALRLEHVSSASDLKLQAELSGTVPDGVRTRIAVRAEGGEWDIIEGPERTLPFVSGQELEAYAEAFAFNGMVLATAASANAPLQLRGNPAADSLVSPEERRLRRKRWAISGSVALVVAAAAVTGYLLMQKGGESGSNATELTPVVEF